MLKDKDYIWFEKTDKGYWLRFIMHNRRRYADSVRGQSVTIGFDDSIKKEHLLPLHLTTLACLIQYLFNNGYQVYLSQSNNDVFEFIFDDLKMNQYFGGGVNHVDADVSDNIFNLWRIVKEEMDLYAKKVELYFKNQYFCDKDLSPLNIGLTESFYNVFDHANAGNVAFSLIKYDEDRKIVHAAICDFGIGIVNSVKRFVGNINSDVRALELALKNSFTVKSTERNKGFGLDNIISNSDTIRVFSGCALFVKNNHVRKFYKTDFEFEGSLIYLEVDISKLEKEEIINNFEW